MSGGILKAARLTSCRNAIESLLDGLVAGWRDDPQMQDTPERVARMYVTETMSGLFEPRPRITTFPNVRELDEIYTVGPFAIRSLCSHHLVPVIGTASVAVLPGERVMGLSKFVRLGCWVFAKPTMQEEATVELADEIEAACAPRGLAVMVEAQHFCMAWRGVKDGGSTMKTSVMRGRFREDAAARNEVLSLLGAYR